MGFAEEPSQKKTSIKARIWNDPSESDEILDGDQDDNDDDDEGADSASGGATAKQRLAKYEKVKKRIRANWEKSWGDMDRIMKEVVSGAVTSLGYDESMKIVTL